MALYINTNVASLSAQRALAKNGATLNQSFERLSTGLRINSAKDDAAGLAIASRFTAQVRGLNQAVRNANDGISMAQTAEAALNEMNSSIQRLRELAVQAANDTNSASDRAALQGEADALVSEIDRIAQKTNFNGRALLDGSMATSKAKFQIGANKGDVLEVSIKSARSYTLGQTYAATLELDSNSANGEPLTAANYYTINGVSIVETSADDDTVSHETTGDTSAAGSAIALAAAINRKSGDTGVEAQVEATKVAATGYTEETAAAAAMEINGITIVGTGESSGVTLEEFIEKVNAKADLTGVIATADGSDVAFTAEDGRDIVFDGADWTAALASVTDADVFRGNVKLVSDSKFTLSATGAAPGIATGGVDLDLSSIQAMKLTSQADAADAIQSLDAALGQVNSQQADLGAMLNRFESAVSSLSAVSENLAAARSRIQDADFAAETAEFTRNQILQQASTSILAQANVSTQVALSLLG